MWFRSKWCASAHLFVFIDNHQLQEVEEQKYLGVLFDKLQWGPQVNYICKKASYLYPLKVSDICYSKDACRIIDSIMIWLCTSSLGASSAGILGILISKVTKQSHLGYRIPSQIWLQKCKYTFPCIVMCWNGCQFLTKLSWEVLQWCFASVINRDICYCTHPFFTVGSIHIKHVAGSTLLVLTCCVDLQAPKDIFVLQLCTTWWNSLPPSLHDCSLRFHN